MSGLKPLADQSPMPFGKYAGRVMRDVPARYLHWLWNQPNVNPDSPVMLYIRENLEGLMMEHPYGTWDVK